MTSVGARRNRILSALPEHVVDGLVRRLEPVRLERGTVLFGQGRPLTHVVFPLSGVISLIAEGDAGEAAEAAVVGRDGVLGPKYLLSPVGRLYAVQQVAGVALRVPFAEFATTMSREPDLADLIDRHTQIVFLRVAQSAVCNRLHSVEQRAARWLLATADRVDGSSFALTHEQLALTLGVQRPTVSAVAAALKATGAIEYRYGVVTVLDVGRLAEAACTCYRAVEEEAERLMPGPRLGSDAASIAGGQGNTGEGPLPDGSRGSGSRFGSLAPHGRSALRDPCRAWRPATHRIARNVRTLTVAQPKQG